MTDSIALTWGTTAVERSQSFPGDAVLPDAEAVYFRGVTVHASAPGLEQLAIGQTVMTMFKLVSFETDHHFTLQSFLLKSIFGDVAVSYRVRATDTGQTRLLAKLLVRYPRAPLGWLMRAALPWGDWLMMRRQLLTLKHLSESPRT